MGWCALLTMCVPHMSSGCAPKLRAAQHTQGVCQLPAPEAVRSTGRQRLPGAGRGAPALTHSCMVHFSTDPPKDRLAALSKALASGARLRGRGFDPPQLWPSAGHSPPARSCVWCAPVCCTPAHARAIGTRQVLPAIRLLACVVGRATAPRRSMELVANGCLV